MCILKEKFRIANNRKQMAVEQQNLASVGGKPMKKWREKRRKTQGYDIRK